jgi:hypothetical protein
LPFFIKKPHEKSWGFFVLEQFAFGSLTCSYGTEVHGESTEVHGGMQGMCEKITALVKSLEVLMKS